MSTDNIFAAQMWSWADPMIKRDSHGRILVVNSSFLQLYGGTVENWTGNPIQGWPMPKTAGEVSRFESRIPLPTGGETVYDWMECTHQDGTAIAMARDVTLYAAAQNALPAPVTEQPAQEPVNNYATEENVATPAPAQVPATATTEAPPLAAASPEPLTEQAPFTSAPVAAIAATASAVTASAVASTAMAAAPAMPQPDTFQQVDEMVTAEPVLDTLPTMPAPPMPEVSPATQPVEPANRDFERRALPIEDGDAILGNNWRDAVIAKAVGVADLDGTLEEESDDGPTVAAKDNGEQVKVLLAEDNAINALLTRTLLEAEGCLCDVVEDGVLAVEAVRNNQYDLVFMDMRMPNMDGLEATRKIRSLGHNAKVLPIVALTANAFDDDRNACFDSGMNDFMTKPVSAEELSAMVSTHTELAAERIAS